MLPMHKHKFKMKLKEMNTRHIVRPAKQVNEWECFKKDNRTWVLPA